MQCMLQLSLLCLVCLLSRQVTAMFLNTAPEPDPRSAILCSPVRCKEAAGQNVSTCGMADTGDVFLFRSSCDLHWFSCLSERSYRPVSIENCGIDGPAPHASATMASVRMSSVNLIGSYTTSK